MQDVPVLIEMAPLTLADAYSVLTVAQENLLLIEISQYRSRLKKLKGLQKKRCPLRFYSEKSVPYPILFATLFDTFCTLILNFLIALSISILLTSHCVVSIIKHHIQQLFAMRRFVLLFQLQKTSLSPIMQRIWVC